MTQKSHWNHQICDRDTLINRDLVILNLSQETLETNT
jgi:hypothetical protein